MEQEGSPHYNVPVLAHGTRGERHAAGLTATRITKTETVRTALGNQTH